MTYEEAAVCEKCGDLFCHITITNVEKPPDWCRFCPDCLERRNKGIIGKLRKIF
jgi:hypothetical protein